MCPFPELLGRRGWVGAVGADVMGQQPEPHLTAKTSQLVPRALPGWPCCLAEEPQQCPWLPSERFLPLEQPCECPWQLRATNIKQ